MCVPWDATASPLRSGARVSYATLRRGSGRCGTGGRILKKEDVRRRKVCRVRPEAVLARGARGGAGGTTAG